jgi:hypothetical protein
MQESEHTPPFDGGPGLGECDPGLAYPSQSGYESWVCERASGELGTGQTTGDLREAPGSFTPIGGTESQATPPDARV